MNKTSKVSKVSKVNKVVNPFEEGSLIGTLFAIGAKGTRPLKDVIAEDVRMPVWDNLRKLSAAGRSMHLSMKDKLKRAHWQYTIIASSKHPTNHMRARSVEQGRGDGKLVHFEALRR